MEFIEAQSEQQPFANNERLRLEIQKLHFPSTSAQAKRRREETIDLASSNGSPASTAQFTVLLCIQREQVTWREEKVLWVEGDLEIYARQLGIYRVLKGVITIEVGHLGWKFL